MAAPPTDDSIYFDDDDDDDDGDSWLGDDDDSWLDDDDDDEVLECWECGSTDLDYQYTCANCSVYVCRSCESEMLA